MMSIYRFRSRGRAACKEATLVQQALNIDDAAKLHPGWESQEVLTRRYNNLRLLRAGASCDNNSFYRG